MSGGEVGVYAPTLPVGGQPQYGGGQNVYFQPQQQPNTTQMHAHGQQTAGQVHAGYYAQSPAAPLTLQPAENGWGSVQFGQPNQQQQYPQQQNFVQQPQPQQQQPMQVVGSSEQHPHTGYLNFGGAMMAPNTGTLAGNYQHQQHQQHQMLQQHGPQIVFAATGSGQGHQQLVVVDPTQAGPASPQQPSAAQTMTPPYLYHNPNPAPTQQLLHPTGSLSSLSSGSGADIGNDVGMDQRHGLPYLIQAPQPQQPQPQPQQYQQQFPQQQQPTPQQYLQPQPPQAIVQPQPPFQAAPIVHQMPQMQQTALFGQPQATPQPQPQQQQPQVFIIPVPMPVAQPQFAPQPQPQPQPQAAIPADILQQVYALMAKQQHEQQQHTMQVTMQGVANYLTQHPGARPAFASNQELVQQVAAHVMHAMGQQQQQTHVPPTTQNRLNVGYPSTKAMPDKGTGGPRRKPRPGETWQCVDPSAVYAFEPPVKPPPPPPPVPVPQPPPVTALDMQQMFQLMLAQMMQMQSSACHVQQPQPPHTPNLPPGAPVPPTEQPVQPGRGGARQRQATRAHAQQSPVSAPVPMVAQQPHHQQQPMAVAPRAHIPIPVPPVTGSVVDPPTPPPDTPAHVVVEDLNRQTQRHHQAQQSQPPGETAAAADVVSSTFRELPRDVGQVVLAKWVGVPAVCEMPEMRFGYDSVTTDLCVAAFALRTFIRHARWTGRGGLEAALQFGSNSPRRLICFEVGGKGQGTLGDLREECRAMSAKLVLGTLSGWLEDTHPTPENPTCYVAAVEPQALCLTFTEPIAVHQWRGEEADWAECARKELITFDADIDPALDLCGWV